MRIGINLASQPFQRNRAMIAASIVVSLALVGTLGALISLAMSERAQLAEARRDVDRLNAQIRGLGAQQAQLDAVLRRMRFPYLRKAAPGVLATARAQRWDPAEVVRILLEEEIRGRDDAGRRIRRKAAGLPAGKTFASWREADSSIPLPAQHALATLEWVTRAENLCIAGPVVIHGFSSREPSFRRSFRCCD